MASRAPSRSLARPARSLRRPRADAAKIASPEQRLAFIEELLTCDAKADGARRALHWLDEILGVGPSVCLLLDEEGDRLQPLAGDGAEPLAFDLADRTHPVVLACEAPRPVLLRHASDAGTGPGFAGPCLAVPLPCSLAARERRIGLLLVGGDAERLRERSTHELARWVGDQLGRLLHRLRDARRAVEAERRTSVLTAVLNAVTDPILLTDSDGRMLVANSRAEHLLASTEGESEGRRRAVALNNMLFSASLSQQALSSNGRSEELPRRELLLVDPTEGSDLLFELISSVTASPRDGLRYVSILRNVADLRRATQEIEDNYRRIRTAEASIRAERDRLDLVIDSVVDPIVVTDPTGNIVLMNTPAERLLTVGPRRGRDDAERHVRANDAHLSSFVSSLFLDDTATRHRGEFSLVDPTTGQPLPVEAVAGKLLTEHGEVSGVVTILHDRTEAIERARLYEQLKQAKSELEEKVRAATAELVRRNELLQRQHIQLEQASSLKSQFLANMSHEFRTPLNAILGYTSMLLQGVSGEVGPAARRSLARVDSNAKHLLSIINDILDIARIESGKMPLHLDEFDVRALVAEVLAELEPIIHRTRLATTVTLDERLPRARSDRQKVKQVVLNLLTNALKFTPEGSVGVSARFTPRTDEIAIAVVDTGIGIADQDHDKVFEDFRQADNSTTREYGGTGLGLSICRRLAHMIGGRITLASKLGQGSTFTLHFPRHS